MFAFLLIVLFSNITAIFSNELKPTKPDFIRINSQIQYQLEKSFREGKFIGGTGFYDPRIGAIVIVHYDGFTLEPTENTEEAEESSIRYKDALFAKIQKTRFILGVRKSLQSNDRLILGTYSKDGYILEIWKKKMLDDLEDKEKGKDVHALYKSGDYIYFENGKNAVLGEYPNWDIQMKANEFMQKKFRKMGLSNTKGMFVPVYGHIFLIEAKVLPVKKLLSFDEKYSKKLRNFPNSGEYIVQYFYGGENGELSRFIKIADSKRQHLSYAREETF